MIYKYSLPFCRIEAVEGYFKTDKTVVVWSGNQRARNDLGGYAQTWEEAKAEIDKYVVEKFAFAERNLQHAKQLADKAAKLQKP